LSARLKKNFSFANAVKQNWWGERPREPARGDARPTNFV
jgi:hypothetical protein